MKNDKIRCGVVGLGGRGFSILAGLLATMEDFECAYACDLYQDRVDYTLKQMTERFGYTPKGTTDWREILEDKDVDAVFVLSAWEPHIEIAIASMNAGKPVAIEVGGAYSLDDCWQLVRTYERTRVPCMFLENCCYGRIEMMVLNMVKNDVFGTVVHCAGGYHHNLRDEILFGEENRHYRLRNYTNRNCENYPTHELGPIMKILNINRGNRMMTLSAVSSSAHGLNEYAQRHEKVNPELRTRVFRQGDVVTTTIKCANGETIVLTLDTTLPRYYSRGFQVRGTKAMYEEQTNSFFFEGEHEKFDFDWSKQWNNAEQYYEKYEHPLWQKFISGGIKGGHGGMDWLVYDAFLQAVKNGENMPIDVYDAAALMCVSTLSEDSIALAGAPVAIPDFTNGRWYNRDDHTTGIYSLE